MHGMTLGQAARVYSLLSIGDGLVSQIPALMIAITAGIVTTRVSSEKKDAHLGKEISDQILKQPKALMIAGGILFLMAGIPGFPAAPFIILSVAVGALGFVIWMSSKRKAAREAALKAQSKLEDVVD